MSRYTLVSGDLSFSLSVANTIYGLCNSPLSKQFKTEWDAIKETTVVVETCAALRRVCGEVEDQNQSEHERQDLLGALEVAKVIVETYIEY